MLNKPVLLLSSSKEFIKYKPFYREYSIKKANHETTIR